MAADWIADVTVSGLQRLYALRLDGAPAADVLAGTAAVWIEIVTERAQRWPDGQGRARLEAAFRVLSGAARRWPAPAELWDHLPPVQQPPALPAPRDRAAARAQIARIRVIAGLASAGVTHPDAVPTAAENAAVNAVFAPVFDRVKEPR